MEQEEECPGCGAQVTSYNWVPEIRESASGEEMVDCHAFSCQCGETWYGDY